MAIFHRAQNTREREGRRYIATSFSEIKVQQFLAIIPEMTRGRWTRSSRYYDIVSPSSDQTIRRGVPAVMGSQLHDKQSRASNCSRARVWNVRRKIHTRNRFVLLPVEGYLALQH